MATVLARGHIGWLVILKTDVNVLC
jgi:hypothetical protein